MESLPEIEDPTFQLMAISLIQEGMDRLDEETEKEMSAWSFGGRGWREYVIFKLNGFDLPVDFITMAVRKKWADEPEQDVERFTRRILWEWGVLR